MRIVLVGTVEFSLQMLNKLIDMRAPLVGIVTSATGERHADFANLAIRGREEHIPVLEVSDANDNQTLSWLKERDPDYVFCFGWSQILTANFLNIPRLGTIGYHPASLPKNRGRHPIVWAIALGLEETASSFFMLDQGIDSGPIVSQERVPITQQDDAGSLYSRLIEVARGQLEAFVPLLENATQNWVEQNEHHASYWRKRSERDGEIDWRMAASTINLLVRALGRPYPGAHFLYRGKSVKLWRCSVEHDVPKNAEAGKVLVVETERVLVKTGIDGLWLENIEPPIFPERGSYL